MNDLRWDTTTFFSSLKSSEFLAENTAVEHALLKLESLFAQHKIEKRSPAPEISVAVKTLEIILPVWNDTVERLHRLSSYVSLFYTTDSRESLANAKRSELETFFVRWRLLDSKLDAWLGLFAADELELHSDVAKSFAHMLYMARTAAKHQLSSQEEELAVELAPSASTAWHKLRDTMASQMLVGVNLPSGQEQLPMTTVRALAKHQDAVVRQVAYRAELTAWPNVAVPFAAAINSIKHRNQFLSKRRGWASALQESVWNNAMDIKTLDAMHAAVVASLPDFRRYLKAKAKLLGHAAGLPWWDLFAPVGKSSRVWTYEQAQEFILQQFGSYSSKMAGLAKRAFEEHWIDVYPREGKRDGAFCSRLWRDQSRILLNFEPSFDSVSTLAHELGHAYHNLCDGERSAMQRLLRPMTLAETASIFCETIVSKAVLAESQGQEHLHMLEMDLQGHTQIVVDIHSRFLFESRLNAARELREQSVEELCELMRQAQQETYGDGLDNNHLHPYMWAVKGHYYSSSFYNYPYTFGALFGLGLYAQYQKDPEQFKIHYDQLLSQTGMNDAITLAKNFGINIQAEDFWQTSIDVMRKSIDEFETLVG